MPNNSNEYRNNDKEQKGCGFANLNPDKGSKSGGRSNRSGNSQGRPSNNSGGRPWRDNGGKKNRTNDRAWYHISPGVNNAVGNLPFSNFPGTYEEQYDTNAVAGGVTKFDSAVRGTHLSTPGVMNFRLSMNYGFTDAAEPDPVNIAATALYTYVRHQNSGHSNYESADLMLYILAMDEIYSTYIQMRRDLSLVKFYELTNRNVPNLLLQTIGYSNSSISDMRSKFAQYRAQLNLIAAKISSMAVPNEFSIFKRHAALLAPVFTDSDSRRAQFYVFSKKYYRRYNATYDTQGGGLGTIAVPYTGSTAFSTQLTNLESMINAVIADEDMNIMSGDILKAFGRENLYTLSELGETEIAPVVFDEDILQQIENAHVVSVDMASCDVHQANNQIIHQPTTPLIGAVTAEVSGILFGGNLYFNSHKEEVSPDDVMEWSRFMISTESQLATGVAHVYAGSEIISEVALGTMVYSTPSSGTISVTAGLSNVYDFSVVATATWVSEISKFDWHPAFYFVQVSGTAPNRVAVLSGPIMDLKKYALVAKDTRRSLNNVALMAELGSLVVSKFRA